MVKKRTLLQIGIAVLSAIIIIGMMIFLEARLGGNKTENYFLYEFSCDNDSSFFTNLSISVYGYINEPWLVRFKEESGHCVKNLVRNLNQEEFEDLDRRCVEWNGTKICPEGFEMIDDRCLGIQNKSFVTMKLVPCSKYYTKEGWVCEVR